MTLVFPGMNISPSIMGGMMSLLELMPEPQELVDAAEALGGHERVQKFIATLGQLMLQEGLQNQAEEPTEPLKLACERCGKEFSVSDAVGYYQRVGQGQLFGCAAGHDLSPVGSGRHGALTEYEAAVSEPEIIQIWPKVEA